MTDLICPVAPMRHNNDGTASGCFCIRERCAWWCPEVDMPETSGRCAIKIGMLSITQLASK